MKLSNLLIGLLGIAALSACSDNDTPGNNGPQDKSEGHFLAVKIANPSAPLLRSNSADGLSRADNDYEEGAENENRVNSLRFYFFNTEGNPVNVDITGGKNFIDCKEIEPEPGNNMPNVEKKLQAIVIINTKDGNTANVNSMVAVVNHEGVNLGTTSLTFNELCEKVDDYSATSFNNQANFLMTSSVYANDSKPICETIIQPKNLCKNEADAKLNPVDIYVERVLAKTRVKTAWDATKVTVKEGVTYNGNTYTAVELTDGDKNSIKVGENQVYVIFTGWGITGTANKSYLFKKVNTTAKWDLGWIWNHSDAHRSYWAMNPAEMQPSYKLSYNDITNEFGNSSAYCMENAADNYDDGTKKVYNPYTELSNCTQAVLGALLVTVDDHNTATPISLAKWAGMDYTEDAVVTDMLNMVTTQIYTKSGETYSSIKPEHVKLVTGLEAGVANDDTESSARYLSYLQLTDEAKAIQFYSSASESATLTTEGVNNILKTIPGAKVWHSGLTYYYTDIRHLGTEATKGLYGMVRNHVYDVNIQSVVGLGTPVLKPDEVIIPQKPGEDETYIAAQINILSWRVVNNNVDLEW